MKKAVVALAVVIGVAANAAEKFALQPVSISGGKEGAAAPSGEVVTVTARGVGANKVEALKDAYRDAVERAVGLYVDAEQQVKNDEVLRDQVLTQSNAYIEKYDLLKEEPANGQVQVRIVAYVKKMALTKRLTEVMPAQTVSVAEASQSLHAQAVTESTMRVDALKLITNELKDFDPIRQLMKVKLASAKAEVETIAGSTGRVRLWYPITMSVDQDKYYKEFVPRWQRILDQIKTANAPSVSLRDVSQVSEAYEKCINEDPKLLSGYRVGRGVKSMTGTTTPLNEGEDAIRGCGLALNEGYVEMLFMRGNIFGVDYMTGGLRYLMDIMHGMKGNRQRRGMDLPSSLWNGTYRMVRENADFTQSNTWDESSAKKSILLITEGNKDRTSLSGRCYQIPDECIAEIFRWQDEYTATSRGVGGRRSFRSTPKTVDYQLRVLDKDGAAIESVSLAFPVRYVSNTMLLEVDKHIQQGVQAALWFVSPLVGGCAKGYVKWIGLEMATDDVAKMASVTIELAE